MPKIYFKSLFSLQKKLNLPIDYEFEKCFIFFQHSVIDFQYFEKQVIGTSLYSLSGQWFSFGLDCITPRLSCVLKMGTSLKTSVKIGKFHFNTPNNWYITCQFLLLQARFYLKYTPIKSQRFTTLFPSLLKGKRVVNRYDQISSNFQIF